MANYYVDWQWTNPEAYYDGITQGTAESYSTFDIQASKKRIALPQKSSDNTSTSITLTGRGLPNYGEIQQENFLRLLENFASDKEPQHPTVGQIWYIPTRVGAARKVNDIRVCTAVTRNATTGLIDGGGTPDAPKATWARIYTEDNLPVTFFNQEDEPNGLNSDSNGHSRYSNKAPKLGDVWFKPTGSLIRICVDASAGTPGDNSSSGIDARWKIMAQWKSGNSFPVTPQKGEVFLRTDLSADTFYYYDGVGRHGGWSEVLTEWNLAYFKGTDAELAAGNRTIAPGFIWMDTTNGSEVQNTVLKICESNTDSNLLYSGATWTKVARWKAGVGFFPSTASYGEIYLKDNSHLYVYTPGGWSEMYTTANRPNNFFYQDAEPASVVDNSGIETARVDGNMWFHPTASVLHVFWGGAWNRIARWKSVTSFPIAPEYGEICYRSDQGLVYMFMNRSDGAYWVPIWAPTNTAAQDPIKASGTVGGSLEFARADHRHRTPYVNELMDWTDGDSHEEGDVARYRSGKWLSEAATTIFQEVKNYLINVGYAADQTCISVSPTAIISSSNFDWAPTDTVAAAISEYKDPFARTVLLQPGWWSMTLRHGADISDINAKFAFSSSRYARVSGNGKNFSVTSKWSMFDLDNNINIMYSNQAADTVTFYIDARGYYQVYVSEPTYYSRLYQTSADSGLTYQDQPMTGDQLATMMKVSEICPVATLQWLGTSYPTNEAAILTFTIDDHITWAYDQYNVYNRAIALGWNQSDRLIMNITIESNGTLYSSNINQPALYSGAGYPAHSSITIVNHGLIVGCGGAGGAGAIFRDDIGFSQDKSYNNLSIFSDGGQGSAGGVAAIISSTVNLYNYGTIAGGGGGGGGGGAIWCKPKWGDTDAFIWVNGAKVLANRYGVSGSGGSGGASYGAGGASGYAYGPQTGWAAWGIEYPGNTGQLNTGGVSGQWGYVYNGSRMITGGTGGTGGAPGQAGNPGIAGSAASQPLDGNLYYSNPGNGGPAGAALSGNSLVIWGSTGTVLGSIY